MFLVLDLSEKDKQNLTFYNKKTKEKKNNIFSDLKNRKLLSSVENFLQKNKINKKDLEAVVVIFAKASFTSTRIACILANSFSYILDIKAVGIDYEDRNDMNKICEQVKLKKQGEYLSALYSGKPNIGK